ncbi:hypothetical protein A3F34_00210 [Candidatus Roizmanbacteria bacterium RIFCSPHIGHO2_12_FULL_44_10]|uniref:Glycosyltransferase RgtA/B/C/D-like domain-containing protein n=1 Tax=Candidatus Roizmanbacteria bacterium RIFCSPHIGHO2_12_FULL_44_10 TaxID=1802054 RepID=A0A1F7I530_9BACT|nr:MAG: hypothetical protein A3F34_00210 [Candidatus Roizmanbacteria bacterium RIFCSPHIGHO2_12_FULL_44_10]
MKRVFTRLAAVFKENNWRHLLVLLGIGLLLRFLLLPIDYSWDVNSFISWGKEAHNFGLSGFYQRPTIENFGSTFPTYAPIPILLFYLIYSLITVIQSVVWQINVAVPVFPSQLVFFFESRLFLGIMMKLPAIFADIFLAYSLYILVDKYKPKMALYVASLVLFNPAFFYTSALWGQIDSLPVVFIVLALCCLLHTKRLIVPWIFFAIALVAKQTSIILLPLLALIYMRKYGAKNSLKGGFIGLLVFMAWFLPFYQSGNILTFPFTTYYSNMLLGSGIPFVSNHAFNFWALITQWTDIPDTTMFLFGIPYVLWGILLTAGFIIPLFYFSIKRKLSIESVFFTAALNVFIIFLFMTKMHERHFQPVLTFLIPLAIANKKYRRIFVLLSIFHMANLYHNWAVPPVDLLINAIRNAFFENAMIIVGLGAFLVLFKNYLEDSLRLRRRIA